MHPYFVSDVVDLGSDFFSDDDDGAADSDPSDDLAAEPSVFAAVPLSAALSADLPLA